MTSELLKKAGRPEPHRAFSGRTSLFSGRARIELAHLGPGHTADNIVAWIPSARILFGGCLVKAQRATDLGNIVDADVKEYPNTLQKLKKAYSRAITVVPGHWEPGGLELIDHSIELCEKAPH
jgi:metallo-beta-lactamase class B